MCPGARLDWYLASQLGQLLASLRILAKREPTDDTIEDQDSAFL